MAYTGNTAMLSCSQGGLTGAKNIDDIAEYMMVYPSRNIILEKNGRRKRGGTAHVYSAAYTGTPSMLGVYEALFESGTSYLLAATAGGAIYKNGSDTIATGLGTTLPYSFAMGENKVFIADGVNKPRVWTGSGSVAEVSEPASDFATIPPFQMMLHGRESSQRMLALNRKGLYFSATYASAGDMEKFSTGAETIFVDAGEGSGLVGMTEFGGDIILFSKKKAYRVDDTDTDSTKWGYEPVQWDGGVASWRLIVKTPNDIICMAEDGEIYSVTAVSSYGDYKRASITKGAWIHDYIKEYVRLSYMSHFHAYYDPTLRAIFFWVVRTGETTVDSALVYFIDRDPAEAWMIHDNQANNSGFSASCSGLGRDSSNGSYILYTGDYAGNLWKLNQTNRNDNHIGYYAGFRTPNISYGDPRTTKLYNKVRVILTPKGEYDLQARTWIDGQELSKTAINMGGSGGTLDAFVLDSSTLGGWEVIEESFAIGRRGKRIQHEFYNAGVDQDFFISGTMTDYKISGNAQ